MMIVEKLLTRLKTMSNDILDIVGLIKIYLIPDF